MFHKGNQRKILHGIVVKIYNFLAIIFKGNFGVIYIKNFAVMKGINFLYKLGVEENSKRCHLWHRCLQRDIFKADFYNYNNLGNKFYCANIYGNISSANNSDFLLIFWCTLSFKSQSSGRSLTEYTQLISTSNLSTHFIDLEGIKHYDYNTNIIKLFFFKISCIMTVCK